MGLNVFEAGYPKVEPIAYKQRAAVDPIERTVAVRISSLTYDARNDRYTYNFKTKLEWANTWGRLVMRFKDGTERSARFKFSSFR